METGLDFWQVMSGLANSHSITIDRPRGSAHPRYPEKAYPLDYGFLENTSAADGGGIDVWIGSQNGKTLTGILCTFDKLKRDAEIKLLISCTMEDIETILRFHKDMATLFIPNPMVEHDLSH
ncbi:MAG: inorganic pyrophosphatase [Syntrophothermus sp.]